jgi:hypothetical protein
VQNFLLDGLISRNPFRHIASLASIPP